MEHIEDDQISFTDPPDSEKLFNYTYQHYNEDFSAEYIRSIVDDSIKSLVGSVEAEVAQKIEEKLIRVKHVKAFSEEGELFDSLLSECEEEFGDLLSEEKISEIMRESIAGYSLDSIEDPYSFLMNEVAVQAYEYFLMGLSENERIIIQGLQPVQLGSAAEIVLFIDKVRFAYSMRNDVESYSSQARAADAIYFGSANDIIMSLFAGIETTYMVDPCLSQQYILDNIFNKVEEVFPGAVYDSGKNELVLTYNNKKYTFKFYKDTLQDFIDGGHGKADFIYTWRCWEDREIVQKALNEGGIYFERH